MKYRKDIDGLRALAVVSVILYHADAGPVAGGYVGVDVFFVISGYLITSLIVEELDEKKFSLTAFYERRCRRILPALFFVVLCATPFAWFFMTPANISEFSSSVVATMFFVSNLFFWRATDYFGGAVELKPLVHTWSLAIEEQYYLLFPIFMVALWRVRRARVAVLVILLVVSLLVAQWASLNRPAAAFYLLPTRAWELLLGATVALLVREGWFAARIPIRNAAAGLGLGLVLFAAVAFDRNTTVPGFPAVVPTLGTALMLGFGGEGTLVGRTLGTPVLVGLGLISYSAYLWHQPILAFVRGLGLLGTLPSIILALISSFALAALSWRFVEQPFRKRMSRGRFFATISGGFLLLVVMGVAGAFTPFSKTVYEARLSPQAKILRDRIEEAKATGGYAAMYTDGACKYWAPDIDQGVVERFDRCATMHGKALLIIGDSHAMDLYNAIAQAVKHPFVVGVSQGGCRPGTTRTYCHYSNVRAMLAERERFVGLILYTQSGGYFLTRSLHPPILEAPIRNTAEFIASLGSGPVVWLGPQNEWNAPEIDSFVLNDKPAFKKYMLDVDRYLAEKYGAGLPNGFYVSKIEATASTESEFVIDGHVTYSDIDHWSSFGEMVFGPRLVKAVRRELAKRNMVQAQFLH